MSEDSELVGCGTYKVSDGRPLGTSEDNSTMSTCDKMAAHSSLDRGS